MGADDDDAVAGYLARAGEASMAGLALWWAFGVGAFVVSGFVMARLPAYANLEPEIALVRRLARAIKVCVVALVALALPVLYVAAFARNPIGTQDATIFRRDLSWNWWFPRPVSQIFAHAFLGPHAKTHPALRAMYGVCLALFVALDSVSALGLASHTDCVAAKKCAHAHGYDGGGVRLLYARDRLALAIEVFALLCLCHVAVVLGPTTQTVSFRVLSKRHDRGAAVREELERCGFVESGGPQRHPLFGLYSRLPDRPAAA